MTDEPHSRVVKQGCFTGSAIRGAGCLRSARARRGCHPRVDQRRVSLSLVLVMVGHGGGDRLRGSGWEVAVEVGAGDPGFGDDLGDGVPGVA